MNVIKESGITMEYDFTPYLVGFATWFLGLNWVALAMLAVAVARLYVAYRELKLKEEAKNASNTDVQKTGKAEGKRERE